MEKNKDFPNFWAAVIILALLIGIQILISMIAYDLGYRFRSGDPKAVGVITVLSCGIIFSALMSYKKISYRDIFNPTSNSFISIVGMLIVPLVLTIGGGIFWITNLTNFILLYFPAGVNESYALSRMLSGGIVSIISVCIIAPFVEEMLFRGIILRSFLENYSVANSIILSSILFALSHLTVTQIPVAFIMGCLFGWLYAKTKSLWPSILGHFLNNSFAIFLLSKYSAPESQGINLTPEFNSPGVIVTALASSTIGVLMLINILKANAKPGAESNTF